MILLFNSMNISLETSPEEKIKWFQIRWLWRPDNWTLTANPCVLKMAVHPNMHLAWKGGWALSCWNHMPSWTFESISFNKRRNGLSMESTYRIPQDDSLTHIIQLINCLQFLSKCWCSILAEMMSIK
jgi:hypothetical protein